MGVWVWVRAAHCSCLLLVGCSPTPCSYCASGSRQGSDGESERCRSFGGRALWSSGGEGGHRPALCRRWQPGYGTGEHGSTMLRLMPFPALCRPWQPFAVRGQHKSTRLHDCALCSQNRNKRFTFRMLCKAARCADQQPASSGTVFSLCLHPIPTVLIHPRSIAYPDKCARYPTGGLGVSSSEGKDLICPCLRPVLLPAVQLDVHGRP